MPMSHLSAHGLIDILRNEGNDVAQIEAKRALGGYPSDLPITLSALANMPGGGVIVLGLDESRGFAVTGVYDTVEAQKNLASQARTAVVPPIRVETEIAEVEGQSLVIARVAELENAHKPCVVKSTGRAYLRSYDGDYPLSEQEFTSFVANRGLQTWDRDPVPSTQDSNLDRSLSSTFVANGRARSPRLAAMSEQDVLRHTRVLTDTDELTLAGLYALGNYPQQFLPTLSVTASVAPRPGDPPGTRSADIAHFDGPLPELLDLTVAWVRRNTATRVRFGSDGHGRDEPEYPLEAVRELVANALVHRDLGPHSLGQRVSVVLEHNRLVVTNPGGLWGLTVEQLGKGPAGSARNQSLYDICKDVRTPDGRRVIEGIGSGIKVVMSSLREAGMTPPIFFDAGVRFTVIVPNHALLDPEDLRWIGALPGTQGLSDTGRHALVAMRHGLDWTNKTLRSEFPMDSTRARALLTDLVDRGLAESSGDGGGRSYRLHPEAAVPVDQRDLPLWSAEVTADVPASTAPASGAPIRHSEAVMSALAAGPVTLGEVETATGLTTRQALYALTKLRAAGLVDIVGGQGKRSTVYLLA